MKRELLFLAISLCVSLTLNAQTITSVVPTSTSVMLGADLMVTVTYTSTTDVTLVAIDLSRYDSNGDVVTNGYVATGSYSVPMPGTGTATATVEITIPDSTTPTSGFTNENYKIKATLHKVTNGNWGTPLDTHIHSENITLTGTPALLFAGDDTSWSLESLTWVTGRKFTKTVMLTNGNKFNFYENNQWGGRHGYTYFTSSVHSDLTDAGNDDNFRFNGTTGDYIITVDLTAKTVGLEPASIVPTISSVVPASVDVGDILSVELTYTSTVDAIVSIELAKYNNSSGDYVDNSQVAYKEKEVVAGTRTTMTITIPIPASTNPTSSLTGESYKVKVILVDRSRNSLATHLKDIELTGTATIAPTISSTVPASVDVGDILSVELTYTSTVDAIVSIELAKYNNSSGDYVDNSQVAYKEKEVAVGAGTTMTITIPIPASTNPTSSLTGESYKVKVILVDRSRNSLATHLKDIELRILPAPVISIGTSTLIAKAGSVISDIFVDSSAGGRVTSYSIAPPIGNGLSFDDTTGIIYGTPTAVAQEIIYTITATNAGGMATATVSITVVSFLGNKDFEKTGFSVSPNPTRDILNITVDEKADYRLLNIRGQVLKKGVSTKGESKINIYSLARGVYFLNIKTGKGSFTEKIVKN